MGGKTGGMDQASRLALDIGYSVITGRNVDYVKIIFDDLVVRLSKVDRKKHVPYVRFIIVVLQLLLGSNYPSEGDYQLPRMGNRLLDHMPEANEVSISTLLSSSSTSSTPSATMTAGKPPQSSQVAKPKTSKCPPSETHLGLSKKAKKQPKEKATPSAMKDSRQSSIEHFVVTSTTSVETTSTTSAPSTTLIEE